MYPYTYVSIFTTLEENVPGYLYKTAFYKGKVFISPPERKAPVRYQYGNGASSGVIHSYFQRSISVNHHQVGGKAVEGFWADWI